MIIKIIIKRNTLYKQLILITKNLEEMSLISKQEKCKI